LGLHVQSTDPQAQQIALKNREEIQPFLDAVGSHN
jgi:hypothetical protein